VSELCVANTPAEVRITHYVCASRRSTRRTSQGFDDAARVIGGRGTRRPASVRGIGAEVLLAPKPHGGSGRTELDIGSDQTRLPRLRWVPAGTGVFAFPVLNVSLASRPINSDALE
jgi:hypothetical protein